MALAAEFKIEDFPQPAGGCCFLTDEKLREEVPRLHGALDGDASSVSRTS